MWGKRGCSPRTCLPVSFPVELLDPASCAALSVPAGCERSSLLLCSSAVGHLVSKEL